MPKPAEVISENRPILQEVNHPILETEQKNIFVHSALLDSSDESQSSIENALEDAQEEVGIVERRPWEVMTFFAAPWKLS